MLNQGTSAGTAADSSTQPIAHSSADIEANPLLANVVCLRTAKRLARRGWIKCQTKIGYKKHNNCSVYDKIIFCGQYARDYDAPNTLELEAMCLAIGYVGLEKMPVEHLAEKLIEYCSRQKLKLSAYNIS